MANPSGNSSDKAAVRVVVRIRPDPSSPTSTISSPSPTSLQFKPHSEEYSFSSVLGQDSTQAETYAVVTNGLVSEALLGYNNTVLAYGQTSSGKTYTMMGEEEEEDGAGIIPRLASELFDRLAGVASEHNQLSVKVSFVEIYRERLRDLLNPSQLANGKPVQELKIREGDSKRVVVDGLIELYINTKEELIAVMQRGNSARSIGATKMNEDSSRSHSVFTLKVQQQQGSGDLVIESKIQLVDLAGSEQVKRTGAHGDRLEEAKSINLSLSCLGNVVSALAEHSKFVPYRDSKLTRILQDSLGGTAKTCLICTVSPHASNEAETLSTLRFGTRAQKVQNHVVKNIRRSEDELERLLALAEDKIRALEQEREDERNLLPVLTVLPSLESGASTEELYKRMGELEQELHRAKHVAESSQAQLDASVKQCRQVELELAEAAHRERMLQIDLKYARDQLSSNTCSTSEKGGDEEKDTSMQFNEEDIAILTSKCANYQVLLTEAKEEVEMLKKSKVDQVWMYLLETQDRLKLADQNNAYLRGEFGALQTAMKHKQERMDAMEWEHAKIKTALREENEKQDVKLGKLREDLKRYRQAMEALSSSRAPGSVTPLLLDTSGNEENDVPASKKRLDETSFMSMDEEQ
ncbi:hypothetical protein BASA81_008077 [Batrachochytrium salamandrivorans]|nr:hypothetical protein BASA81_008077 [Batrachochytrium salamandrivorans]